MARRISIRGKTQPSHASTVGTIFEMADRVGIVWEPESAVVHPREFGVLV
jgi:hypothetical protein